ncbi:hypothetical protein [Streptomyces canus]|nr:hypothetical protein [Streptomyces canus]MDQ1068157.1 hypothetical protein [Streptomyces canus]
MNITKPAALLLAAGAMRTGRTRMTAADDGNRDWAAPDAGTSPHRTARG